jgi:ribosome-associated translation inhibitor RaiA
VSKSDFHLDFTTRIPDPAAGRLEAEADQRLRDLASTHTDMIGAAVVVEELSNSETPHAYRARVVVYIRPQNIAAIEVADAPELALDQALSAAERQVRKKREVLSKHWQQPEELVRLDNIYDLTPAEIYYTYFGETNPEDLLDQDRDEIAAVLITQEGLDQRTAYYAADQILAFAQETVDASVG